MLINEHHKNKPKINLRFKKKKNTFSKFHSITE